MNKKTPLVSIIVITWNRLLFTKNCLDALLFSIKKLDCEIIVVDNGSTDGTAEYLQKLKNDRKINKLHIFPHNKGCGKATNKGMSMAEGQYIVEVDNDIVLLDGWWWKCLEIMNEENIGQIGILPANYPVSAVLKGINIAPPNVAGAWMIKKESYDKGIRWCEDSWKETPWQAVLFSAWFRSKGLLVGNIAKDKFAVDIAEGNHHLFPEYYKKTFKDRNIEYLLEEKLSNKSNKKTL